MYILFDIGATKMRVAVSRNGKSFDRRTVRIVATPKRFADGIAVLQQISRELAYGGEINGAAGGVAGSLDIKKETIFRAPNMPDWSKRPFRKALQKALGTKNVYIENDTALVGLGEAVQGAGKGKPIVAYITASTGINGARIVNGKIDQNALGFEIGHQFVAQKPLRALEYFVGAASLQKRYGIPAEKIRNPAVWEAVTKYLAIGIHNTTLHWSPHVVVLGGGSIQSGNISIAQVQRVVNKLLIMFPKFPPIKKATLGDFGGLYGALVFLRQQKS